MTYSVAYQQVVNQLRFRRKFQSVKQPDSTSEENERRFLSLPGIHGPWQSVRVLDAKSGFPQCFEIENGTARASVCGMDDNEKCELVEPFDVDDGSLRGLRPEYVFALGVEWEMFRKRLAAGTPFTILCLPHNRQRLVRMAERNRRFVEDRQTACPQWAEIWVGDLISSELP